MLAKELLEDPPHLRGLEARHQDHREDLAAEGVTHCQWLAFVTVASPPPALEVDGPQVIGSVHLDPWPSFDRPNAHGRAAALHLAEAEKNTGNRASRGRTRAELPSKNQRDLLGPVAGVALLELEDADHDLLTRSQGT
jgi:hypothetical protein